MTRTVAQIKKELAALGNEKAHLKAMDRLQNEGGEGYSAYDDKGWEIAQKEYALEQELFGLEWTQEVTQARRKIWNGEMQKLIDAKAKVTTKELVQIGNRIGFQLEDLKKAMALHGL